MSNKPETREPDASILLYLETLKSENSSLRSCAAQVLGRTGRMDVIEPLLQALDDEDSWVRKHVMEALGRLGAGKAIPHLEKMVHMKEKPAWSHMTLGECALEAIRTINASFGNS